MGSDDMIGPLHRRVMNMVARAVVKVVNDSKKAQLLQLAILDGEVKDDVERLQPYGFTSVPKDGAEAVVVFPGGKRDHGIVVVVEDRRYRLKALEGGEVAMYDATGSTVVMKKNGDIEATPSSGKLKITGDLTVTGKIDVGDDATFSGDAHVSGDTSCDGTVTGSTEVVGNGIHLSTHKHLAGTLAAPSSGGPVTGDTGAPE